MKRSNAAFATMSLLVAVGAMPTVVACGSDVGGSLDGTSGDTAQQTGPLVDDPGGGREDQARDGGHVAQSSGLPCNVDAILAKDCRSCHGASPTAGAPNSLVTWADLQAVSKSNPGKTEFELTKARTHDDVRAMPPPPNTRLSAADQAVIDDWVAKGAPKSTEVCGTSSQPSGDGTEPLTCTPDLHFAPAAPYEMAQSQLDQYVCYGVDVPAAAAKHIVAFAPKIDNKKIVHHVLMFRSPTAVSGTPTACSAGGSIQWSLMFGWAPGGKNMYMPAEAGYPLDPKATSHFVVQVHYNNAMALAGQKDATGMDMCTAAPRKYEADVVAFGSMNFTIPPNAAYSRTCTLTVPQSMDGRTFVAAMPHMHNLGTAIDTKLTPKAGGAAVDMGGVTNWNFQNQYWLPVTATAKAGDTVTTHCAWKNTTSAPVKFGENTENEMCYSFTMYYPKVTAPLFSWMTPSLTASCK